MSDQMIFKRYEIKYMITEAQYEALRSVMEEHMIADEHGRNTTCSLYFDTPNYLLIRRSIDHPLYKEKIRLRSYGVANADTKVFVELKKKFDDMVYKRRVGMSEADAWEYLSQGKKSKDTQIIREIDYCLDLYKGLAPAVMLSYEREAFYGKNDHEFRVTFDRNILWRDYDLTLRHGIYGNSILNGDQVLMEVKTGSAIPMWMVRFLTENEITKTSFSKYGTAYSTMYQEKEDLLGIKQSS